MMTPGAIVGTLHGWAAVAAAVVAALLVVLGVLQATGRIRDPMAKRWLDRALLALLVVVAAAALLGPVVLALGHPPRDWLHLVYAAVALGVAPVLRIEAARRRSPRMGAWIAVGGLVTLGALLRLWGTGG